MSRNGFLAQNTEGYFYAFISINAQNLAQLMLIAFMFDQMQHLLSPLFNKALVICKSKKML